jgi:hypothetical protein
MVTDTESSSGVAWADYDRDGDLDLFVTSGEGQNNVLYRNNGNGNNWINIRCVGTVSNKSAIGAKIRLKATTGLDPIWQMREISSQTGRNGQNSLNAHFGLGDASIIDSIRIEWPSGLIRSLTNVEPNQFLTITEGCCGIYTTGITGNANCSIDGKLTLSDITKLIDRVYISKDPLCCEATGNTNGSVDCKITLSDITVLIDAVYISKSPPADCMPECEI